MAVYDDSLAAMFKSDQQFDSLRSIEILPGNNAVIRCDNHGLVTKLLEANQLGAPKKGEVAGSTTGNYQYLGAPTGNYVVNMSTNAFVAVLAARFQMKQEVVQDRIEQAQKAAVATAAIKLDIGDETLPITVANPDVTPEEYEAAHEERQEQMEADHADRMEEPQGRTVQDEVEEQLQDYLDEADHTVPEDETIGEFEGALTAEAEDVDTTDKKITAEDEEAVEPVPEGAPPAEAEPEKTDAPQEDLAAAAVAAEESETHSIQMAVKSADGKPVPMSTNAWDQFKTAHPEMDISELEQDEATGTYSGTVNGSDVSFNNLGEIEVSGTDTQAAEQAVSDMLRNTEVDGDSVDVMLTGDDAASDSMNAHLNEAFEGAPTTLKVTQSKVVKEEEEQVEEEQAAEELEQGQEDNGPTQKAGPS